MSISSSSTKPPFLIVRDDAPAGALAGAVVAIGNFDGVHRGHRQVIAAAQARAQALGAPAAALTFEPHPRAFLRPSEPLFRLFDAGDKLRLLAGTGLDGALVITFDAALAALSATEFVDKILVRRCRIAGAVIGSNFFFGRERAGSPDFLAAEAARLGFAIDIAAPVERRGRLVSSGAIRGALEQGRVEEAADLLGFPWFVTATVLHGDKRGRTLGYPTANLRLDPSCALKHGIYAVRVGLDGTQLDAVASFGRRPTFDHGAALLEVFIFDFSADLYGRTIDVAFLGRIRDEMKFASVDDLIRRMDEDSREARAILARHRGVFPPLGNVDG
jgi:riboflavin kinase/FMN adenylyltransferase